MNCKEIKDYLRNMAKMTEKSQMAGFYEWLLKNGECFETQNKQLSKSYFDDGRHKVKQCFYNSAINLLSDDKLKYYEGYYLPGLPIALKHAWNVKKGEVIDTTSIAGNFEVDAYFGVEIPKNIRLIEYEQADTFLDALEWYWLNYIKKK